MGETQSKGASHDYPEHMVADRQAAPLMAEPDVPFTPSDVPFAAVYPAPVTTSSMVTSPAPSLAPQTACSDVPFQLSPELLSAVTSWQTVEWDRRLDAAHERIGASYQYDFSLERSTLRDIAARQK